MRNELFKEPPPDIEFPYFEVVYYDQPESVGIKIKATDGRSERWQEESRTIHGDGSINDWRSSDEGTQYRWKQKVGELLKEGFLLRDHHLKTTLEPMIGRRCFLVDFPQDYKLFTQTKDGRMDHYLIGSETASAFRSPQEFFLHALWLMKGAKSRRGGSPDCECKYCDGSRTQQEIDEDYQLPGRKDSGHRSSGRHAGPSAASSETIIQQAKDYRNIKKPSTGVQQAASKGIESIDLALV